MKEGSKWWYERGLCDAMEMFNREIAWLRAENDGLKAANELCGKNYEEAIATIHELRDRSNAL